jgi:hypothetical protein
MYKYSAFSRQRNRKARTYALWVGPTWWEDHPTVSSESALGKQLIIEICIVIPTSLVWAITTDVYKFNRAVYNTVCRARDLLHYLTLRVRSQVMVNPQWTDRDAHCDE